LAPFFPSLVRRAKIKIECEAMNGIQFVTDEKGRKVAVQIDLKKYGAIWEDFWDGLVSESRRKEKGIPFEEYRDRRLRRQRRK
jgi:ribosomal protein L33